MAQTSTHEVGTEHRVRSCPRHWKQGDQDLVLCSGNSIIYSEPSLDTFVLESQRPKVTTCLSAASALPRSQAWRRGVGSAAGTAATAGAVLPAAGYGCHLWGQATLEEAGGTSGPSSLRGACTWLSVAWSFTCADPLTTGLPRNRGQREQSERPGPSAWSFLSHRGLQDPGHLPHAELRKSPAEVTEES